MNTNTATEHRNLWCASFSKGSVECSRTIGPGAIARGNRSPSLQRFTSALGGENNEPYCKSCFDQLPPPRPPFTVRVNRWFKKWLP